MWAPESMESPTTSTSSCTAAVAIISGVWCRPVYTTSIPASRRAAATTLAPRSWPSRPGLATRTRIGRVGLAAIALIRGEKVIHQVRNRRGYPAVELGHRLVACQQHGVQTRRSGSQHIDIVEIAHVQRLLRCDAEGLQRRVEDTRVRLLHTQEGGIDHHVEVVADPSGGEGLLDSAIAIGYHAELEACLTQPGQRLGRALGEHRPEMPLAMHTTEAVADPVQRFRRNPAEQEQRLEVGCSPVAVAAGLQPTSSLCSCS